MLPVQIRSSAPIFNLWGCSSVGRARALQARCRRFDPGQLHHGHIDGAIAQLGERGVRNAEVAGSIPASSTSSSTVTCVGRCPPPSYRSETQGTEVWLRRGGSLGWGSSPFLTEGPSGRNFAVDSHLHCGGICLTVRTPVFDTGGGGSTPSTPATTMGGQ